MDTYGVSELLRRGFLWRYGGDSSQPHALLSSGLHSDVFINATELCCDQRGLEQILPWGLSYELFNKFGIDLRYNQDRPDLIVCPGYGAIGFASFLSRELRRPFAFTDKVEGKHIMKRFNVKGKNVLICEDVVTTGKSINQVFDILLACGAEVRTHVLALFDRRYETNIEVGDYGLIIHSYFHIPAVTYTPEDCPMCKQGSVVLKPKENWSLF